MDAILWSKSRCMTENVNLSIRNPLPSLKIHQYKLTYHSETMQEAFRIVSLCCETSQKVVGNAKLPQFYYSKINCSNWLLGGNSRHHGKFTRQSANTLLCFGRAPSSLVCARACVYVCVILRASAAT